MTAIKFLLVATFLGALIWGFRNRGRVGIRAGARVLIVGLTGVAIASVIDPDIPQMAATAVGVTRGTDLVLYVLVVVFILTSAGMYFRFRDLERRMADLVRATAIQNAVATQDLPAIFRAGPGNDPVRTG